MFSSSDVNHSIQEIKFHDHLSLIYENREELFDIVIPFITEGLDIGDKCFLLLNEPLRELFISKLKLKYSNIDSPLELGKVELINSEEFLAVEEGFTPDKFSLFLESLYNDSLEQGYSSIRIVKDMSWMMEKNLTISQLLNYESAVNKFYLYHQACGICQYDRNRFGPEFIIQVLKTHRLIINNHEIYSNPFYTSPSEIDLTCQAECDVNSLLNGLHDLKKGENELVSTIRNLKYLVESNKDISGTMDMEKVVNEFINNIAVHMDAAAVALLTYDPDRKELSYHAARGFLEKYDLDQIHVPIENFSNSRLDQNQELVFINSGDELSDQPSHIQLFQEEIYKIYIAHPLKDDDNLLGVLETYITDSKFDFEDWHPYIKDLVSQLTNAIDNAQAYQELQQKNLELTMAYDMTIARINEVLEKRNDRISRNTQRMADMTEKLAREMGASEEELIHIKRGVLLQSISNMTLPEKILNKTGPLNEKEWDIVHQHPQMIFDLLEDIKILLPALEIPYCHHENWDGSGYPRGLTGEEIPLSARQFAVVNVFDALLTERPYRSSWEEEDALAYIRSLSSVQFDPNVVDAFVRMLKIQD